MESFTTSPASQKAKSETDRRRFAIQQDGGWLVIRQEIFQLAIATSPGKDVSELAFSIVQMGHRADSESHTLAGEKSSGGDP